MKVFMLCSSFTIPALWKILFLKRKTRRKCTKLWINDPEWPRGCHGNGWAHVNSGLILFPCEVWNSAWRQEAHTWKPRDLSSVWAWQQVTGDNIPHPAILSLCLGPLFSVVHVIIKAFQLKGHGVNGHRTRFGEHLLQSNTQFIFSDDNWNNNAYLNWS